MSSAKKRGKTETDSKRDVLQAVVVADSFNFRFLPITLEKPRALLPLVNRPLIDYTLEFLLSSGIEDIIVLCRNHADQIKEHIDSLKMSRTFSQAGQVEMTVVALGDNSSMSAGDCLRELERKHLVRSDFVLVSGDLLANMNLKEALVAHKARREMNKSAVMTLVLKEAAPGHRTRCSEDDVLVGIEPSGSRLLFFQGVAKKRKFGFPLHLLSEHSDVQLRYDLMDCHVSICSPEVPQLFQDNFDYLSRDDFIRGVLVHEEITGHQIHTHIISDQYAARVSNLHSYDSISKDVIQRWTYPLVPDTVLLEHTRAYSYSRGNIYLGANVTLARECILEEGVVIGRGSSIGDGSKITNSVVGKNCTIGKKVRINGAFIWDNVIVGDDCVIHKSIICSQAQLKQCVTISNGCILSFNVVVGPDVILPPTCKVTTKQQTAEEQDDFDDVPSSVPETISQTPSEPTESVFLGSESRGHAFLEQSVSDEEFGEADLLPVWGLTPYPPLLEDDDSSVCSSGAASPSRAVSPVEDDDSHFYREILESIHRGVEEKVAADHLILEINASKHAYNVNIEDVPVMIMKAILQGPARFRSDLPSASGEMKIYLLQAMTHLKRVLLNYVGNKPAVQQLVLSALLECCAKQQILRPLFQQLVDKLYQDDIVLEDVIIKWYDSALAADTAREPDYAVVLAKAGEYVAWLQEAEEESDD